jgi:hypothetical protein
MESIHLAQDRIQWRDLVNIQDVAGERMIIKTTIIQTLYLQNYKNITLKYTTKLITF